MKSYNVYVVEDMAVSRIALIDILEENGYVVKGSAARADVAWLQMKEMDLDIVLLDINLAGERDGIWLANKIRKSKNVAIIYITAYGDKATLENLQTTSPNGYLMKPYNKPTLLTTIEIAITSFNNEHKILRKTTQESPVVYIKDKRQTIKLEIAKIFFIKSDGNYLDVVLQDTTYTIREKLTDFLDKLPEDMFVQIHRRYAVNIKKITSFGVDNVVIKEEVFPISNSYKSVISKFEEH